MTDKPTALERAFELARSGECEGLPELKDQLRAQGYGLSQITGPSLIKQLRAIITASYNPPLPDSTT